MADNKHTRFDLAQMQSLPLQAKIEMTKRRIQEWYEHWDGMVSVSFSGGKDSTVLLDIVRNRCGYKDVPAVFVDTGLEYPEIRKFAMSFDNVVAVKPKQTFKQVIEKYGYPFISKEVSECVYGARKYLKQLVEDMDAGKILTDRQTDRTRTDSENCLGLVNLPNFLNPHAMLKFLKKIMIALCCVGKGIYTNTKQTNWLAILKEQKSNTRWRDIIFFLKLLLSCRTCAATS